MEPLVSQSRRTAPPKNSRPVLLMLVLFSYGIIVFTLILIGCSFAINYSTDLRPDESDDDPKGNEWEIQVSFNYDQYWAGIPFLATGLLVLLSGIYQRSRTRAIIAAILCIVAIGLSLLVLTLNGMNLSWYMARERTKIYWESKDYTCKTSCGHSDSEWKKCRKESSRYKYCLCLKNGDQSKSKSFYLGCEQISKLAALYASVLVSSIIVALCCVSSLIIIAMTLLWKRTEHNHIDDNADHVGTSSNAPLFVALPTINNEERVERVARHAPISTTIM